MAPVDPRTAAPIRLHHMRTGQTMVVDLFDERGRLRTAALAELRGFLADPRSGVDHPVHWRLATLLVAVAAHYPERELEVVSGFRRDSRHASRSNHTRGRALDFRIRGVQGRRLFETLRRSFDGIGVGYYPNSTFVHLDVRRRAAVWVDYAGPGQSACYSKTPYADLRDGTAEHLSYAAAQARGCLGS